ncbi:MAG TPA: NADP oxidoreductase, partial [Solirubrobacterales bacterium]
GFFLAERLLSQSTADWPVEVDMLERLPVPYGLVRFGVAPDHEKIKAVTRSFDKVASKPGFRYFGNVDVGSTVTLADLSAHYHAVAFTTGAQSDRRMNIPGEDLSGSHAATEFVAWYNGHPDFTHLEFDLSVESVAVVGVGNVAVDVCRILSRTPEELEKTDIADYALDALRESRIKEVYMLGRRGPAQAAFTNPEVKELGELEGADVTVPAEEAELDELSRKALDERPDRSIEKKIQILQEFARRERTDKPKLLVLRFLVSPVEIIGDEQGRVSGMRLVRNELYLSEKGTLRPRPTGVHEELPVQMVFRSVGYRGVPLKGLPFHDRWGVVPNEKGRVVDPETSAPLRGIYVSGWIKRGATGIIGTNKPDAGETVECMVADLSAGAILEPERPDPAQAEELVRKGRPAYVDWEKWLLVCEAEESRGAEADRPRVKFTSVEEILAALQKVE